MNSQISRWGCPLWSSPASAGFLPDVPEENYWFRRHLVVYEWIAKQCAGKRVADLACGEGYGSGVLAQEASNVIGINANPEAFERARLKFFDRQPALRAQPRGVVRHRAGCHRLPADDRTHPEPRGAAARLRPPCAGLLRLDPEPADAGAGGCREVRQPVAHSRSTRTRSTAPSSTPASRRSRSSASSTPRKLQIREIALSLGWDRVHKTTRLTKPFYDRFTPAIAASDFALRPDNLDKALDFVAVCHA